MEYFISAAIAVILVVLFEALVLRRERRKRTREFDQGMKRSAETRQERHP